MKYLIDKAAFDALDPVMQALYKAQGDQYVLAVEGLPQNEDVEGLKRQNQTLLDEAKEAKRKAREAQEQLTQKELDAAKARGDYESLYASSEQTLAAERQKLADLQAGIEKRDMRGSAAKVAAQIADGPNAEIIADYIERRLRIVDGQVRVTDASGNLTVSTLEQLGKEFQEEPRFASLVRGSQANGGGAAGLPGGGATKTWDQMSGMERVELRRNDPAEHARRKAAAQAK